MRWLNAGYIRQTLGARGVPVPTKGDLDKFIASLQPEAASLEVDRVRRIAMGVESSDDLQCFLDSVKRMSSVQPTTQTRRTKPEAISAPAAPEQQAHTEFLRSHGVHIYGKSAALKIELDSLRGHETQPECYYTVLIEGAHKGRGTGYDWGTKIPFQLTRRELPLVAAFLLGFSSSKLELKNHGPEANKSLTLEEQKGKLFVRVAQTGRASVPVPVEPADVFAWGELCMVALQLNRPTVSPEIHLALLRRVGRMGQQPLDA